jgi:hypothetical protein
MREYHYRVDAEGRVFHDDTEIVDPHVLRFFLLAMTRTPDGRHLVMCQGERNWFEARDTPFVVQRVAVEGGDGAPASIALCFAGDWREPLDPRTLATRDGALFCGVRRGAFRARFGRVALQQLAPFRGEDAHGPVLVLAGARHPIADAAAAPAATASGG